MTQTDKKIIVVGGGIAGLFAAKVLVSRGYSNIHLIERNESVGGLLQSVNVENPLGDGRDYDFDYGTHFVLTTGRKAVDELVLHDLDDGGFYRYDGSLYEGHYISETLYLQSGCPHITSFSQEVQDEIKEQLDEIVSAQKSEVKAPENLEQLFVQRYGQKAYEHVWKPMFYKITARDLREVSADMGVFFVPQRLIVGDRQSSIELKQEPGWDDIVAYANCEDSQSDIVKYYPKRGAIDVWPRKMAENLERNGVKIHTGVSAESLKKNDNSIDIVTLSDGQEIECDHLVWTLPPAFLGNLSGIEIPMQRPVMRRVGVVNILTDQRPTGRAYWVNNYDQDFSSFRVTLYDNFVPLADGEERFRVTVEIFHDGDFEGSKDDQQAVFEELIKMTILPENAQRLWSQSVMKKEAFPVLTPEFLQTTHEQVDILKDAIKNLILVGYGANSGYGQMATMCSAYDEIEAVLEESQEQVNAA